MNINGLNTTVFITNATFTLNSCTRGTAYAAGAAINSGGKTTINSTTFSYNSATSGGAIYNGGIMIIGQSRIMNNVANSAGGGIHQAINKLYIEDSIMSGNRATSGVALSIDYGSGTHFLFFTVSFL